MDMKHNNQQLDVREKIIEKTARNYGVDILKILSMFMVVVLHILGSGGVRAVASGVNGSSAEFLHTMTFCAVNVFGLTTGYLMANRKVKYARIVGMWVQIVFYGLILTLLMSLFSNATITTKNWLQSFFPIAFGQWWYISAYFGLFFLMPYLNRLLATLSNKQGLTLSMVLLILFSGLSTISPADAFYTHDGFSVIWLCILYIWGALIKRYENEIQIKPRWFALGYLLTVIFAWISVPAIKTAMGMIGFSVSENLLMQYDSVLIVAMAIMLMLFFLKVKLPGWLGRIAGIIAPLSFAVYIIHGQIVVYRQCITERFIFLAEQNVLVMILGVFGCAALIFAVCALIEWGRVWLFKLLRINKLTDKIGGWMNAKLLPEETTAQSSKE